MLFLLEPLLAEPDLQELRDALSDLAAPWIEGASTAGWHARGPKRNHQLDASSALHQQLVTELEERLMAQPVNALSGSSGTLVRCAPAIPERRR
jgi:PKHD-type hydroxylase